MHSILVFAALFLSITAADFTTDQPDPLADLLPEPEVASIPWPYDQSHALVVGVNHYVNGWQDLPGARRDSQLVSAVLQEHGFTVTAVEDITYEGIDRAIRHFIQTYGQNPNNRLVFYFSGHGYTLTQVYGAEAGYFVASDAPLPTRDEGGFRARSFNMDIFEYWAREIQAKHALFVFDSCFSGSFFTRGRYDATIAKANLPVRQFITSGGADERVPDQSIFCGQFVAGLRGEGDLNGNGWISGVELGEFLYERVVDHSKGKQHPQSGKLPDSRLDKGDVLFRVPADGPLSTADLAFVPPAPEVRSTATDFVIAVAPFVGPSDEALAEGKVMKQMIERKIYDFTDGAEGVRMLYEDFNEPIRSADQAREAGRKVGASIVIWGDVIHLRNEVAIAPYITKMAKYSRSQDRPPKPLLLCINEPDQLVRRQGKAEEISNLALLMAGSYYLYRDSQRAAEILYRSEPQTSESLRLIAAAQLAGNDVDTAIGTLKQAIAIAPDDLTLYIALGRIYTHRTRFAEADEIYTQAAKIEKDSPWLHIWWGSMKYDEGKYAEAEELFARVGDVDPGDSFQKNLDLGQYSYRRGRYQEALTYYANAAIADPESAEPLMRQATVFTAMGDYDQALATIRESLERSDWVWAQNQLGGIYVFRGEYDKAEAALREAVRMDPDYQWTYQNLGGVLVLVGRLDEAIALFEEAGQDQGLTQNFLFRHLALFRSGRGAEAVQLARALKIKPSARDVSTTIARLFAGEATVADVLESTRTGSEVMTRLNLAEAHYFLGMTYLAGAAPDAGIAKPDTLAAIDHLRACVDTEAYVFIEYHYAKAELAKLIERH